MEKYLAGLMILLAACGDARQPKAAEQTNNNSNTVTLNDDQLKNAHLVIAAPQQMKISRTIHLNGLIDVPPQNLVSISAPLGGYVKLLKLLPGMHVTKGEVLAVLEDIQFIQLQQDYLAAKAKLQYLEQEYHRQKELNINKVSSDKLFQQVQGEYTAQQVAVRALSEKLALIGIRADHLNEQAISRSIPVTAPINGYVATVKVNTGKYVSPTEVICQLIDPSDIHLNLNVFEKDINALQVGQTVKAFTNEHPEDIHEAKIILVTRNLDAERAGEVHCHFEKYDTKLVPGMFMNADVAVSGEDVQAVPDDAVLRWENKNYVFIARDAHTFELWPVEKGTSSNGYTAINGVGGKAIPQEKIVTGNAYTLLMKMKNKVEEE